MKKITMAPATIGRKIFNHIPLLLAAISLAGCLQTTTPANAAETGIRGTVLCGPVHPGATSPGHTDEAPLRASFSVFGLDKSTARFKSDDKGSFEVSLPPGDYTIVPDKNTPIPNASRQRTQVTVPEDGFAVVTIRLDTGMK